MALVFDIQRACLHDGPGLRTTVFLKGCPLRCAWCHNPESQSFEPEWMAGADHRDRGRMVGERMDIARIMETVRSDRAYFDASGGGITVSGGEPMASFEFARELLRSAKADGIHTCLDTSGAAPVARYREIAPYVDTFLWDVKLSDRDQSLRMIGLPPEVLWSGLGAVDQLGASTILRCPIIPGLNDCGEHFGVIANLASSLKGIREIHLIPYHRLGRSKRERLGRSDVFEAPRTEREDLDRWLKALGARACVPVSAG